MVSKIDFPIRMKFNPNVPPIELNHPGKFGKDVSKHSRVIGQTLFNKMAAWWPYWISDQAAIQSQHTLDRGESSLEIWERYLKVFLSY